MAWKTKEHAVEIEQMARKTFEFFNLSLCHKEIYFLFLLLFFFWSLPPSRAVISSHLANATNQKMLYILLILMKKQYDGSNN